MMPGIQGWDFWPLGIPFCSCEKCALEPMEEGPNSLRDNWEGIVLKLSIRNRDLDVLIRLCDYDPSAHVRHLWWVCARILMSLIYRIDVAWRAFKHPNILLAHFLWMATKMAPPASFDRGWTRPSNMDASWTQPDDHSTRRSQKNIVPSTMADISNRKTTPG